MRQGNKATVVIRIRAAFTGSDKHQTHTPRKAKNKELISFSIPIGTVDLCVNGVKL